VQGVFHAGFLFLHLGFGRSTDVDHGHPSFLDGKQATTFGDLSPAMTYSYAVTATGLATTRAYLDGPNLREAVSQAVDWAGRPVRSDFADGAIATVSYNALGQMIASTDSDGVTTLMAYNSRGEQTISAIDLNANGQIDYGTDTVSFSDSFPALNTGNPVIRSLQKVWQPGDTNPAAGTVVSITDSTPDGLASTSTQLGVANPATSLTTLGTGGNMTQTQVSPDGSYTVSTIVAGRPDVTAFYNNANVLVASTAARDASNTPGSGYDSLGRPTHQYDSRTGVTTTAYLSATADVAASTTDPGNRTTSFTYDVRGRQTTVDAPDTLDANGALLTNITTTSYFPDGQVQEVNGGQTYRVSHTYDYADRQKTLTTYGATPAVTTWSYSPTRGFLTRKEYADGKGTNYTYTPAGRLATRAWARGVTTTYSYDAGGRLTLTDYSDTTRDVALSYDALGRKITESQTNRTQYSFTYNPVTLAPTSETLAYDLNADGTPDFTRVLDRGQDSLQRDSGWQLKDGATIENQVTYAYDPAGRLASVTSPAGPFTYAYQANSVGLLSSVTSPAHTVTNTWENTRDVLARKQNAVGASVISAYDYSVNPLGQRTEVAKTGSAFASNRSIAWGYDSLGQVVKADSTAGFNRAYQYDGIGNRKKAADSLTLPATDNYTANALNQYTAVDTINPAYDDDGNATAYPLPAHLSANSTLAWDAENRLVSATVNGTTTTYLYDSGSRRIAQTTGSATTVYIYDAWNPVAEYTGTTLAKTYTWGLDLSGSMQGAGGVGGLLAVTEGTTSHFPTYDGNGNISEYLDSAGATVAHYEYDPFGRTTVSTGTKWGDFAHRFSTKPIDYPTGLYYYGYRYYDPVTGRWPSRDRIGERGGVNLYGFVANSLVGAIDALGLTTLNSSATIMNFERWEKWWRANPWGVSPGDQMQERITRKWGSTVEVRATFERDADGLADFKELAATGNTTNSRFGLQIYQSQRYKKPDDAVACEQRITLIIPVTRDGKAVAASHPVVSYGLNFSLGPFEYDPSSNNLNIGGHISQLRIPLSPGSDEVQIFNVGTGDRFLIFRFTTEGDRRVIVGPRDHGDSWSRPEARPSQGQAHWFNSTWWSDVSASPSIHFSPTTNGDYWSSK
jgi:RHS repeat-associated protein